MKNVYIQKRDGTIQEFNREKIENAICKAFLEVDKEISDYAKTKAANIADYIQFVAQENENSLTIDEI